MGELILTGGRPTNTSDRQDREVRCYDFLDNLGVEYQRIDHEPAMTMEICSEIEKTLNAVICKNLFLCNRQKTNFYLLMMPGDKKFLTKNLSKQIGSARLSFADESYMISMLDLFPGSVSVLGLMNDKEKKIQLIVDKDLMSADFIGCHPCANTSSLRIKKSDMFDKIIPALTNSVMYVGLEEE